MPLLKQSNSGNLNSSSSNENKKLKNELKEKEKIEKIEKEKIEKDFFYSSSNNNNNNNNNNSKDVKDYKDYKDRDYKDKDYKDKDRDKDFSNSSSSSSKRLFQRTSSESHLHVIRKESKDRESRENRENREKEKENNNQSTFNATINIPPNSLNHSNVSSSNTTTTSSSSLSSLNTNANGLLFTNSQQQLPQRAQKFKMKSKSNEKLDFEIPHLTPNLAIEKNSHRRKHFSMEVTPTVIPEEEKDSNKKKKNKNNLHNPNEPQMLHYFKAEILEAIEPFLGNQFDCIFCCN